MLLPIVNIGRAHYHVHVRSYKKWAECVAAAVEHSQKARGEVSAAYKAQQAESENLNAQFKDWQKSLKRRQTRMRMRNGTRNRIFVLDKLREAGYDVDTARKSFWLDPDKVTPGMNIFDLAFNTRRNNFRRAKADGDFQLSSDEEDEPPAKGKQKSTAKPTKGQPTDKPNEQAFDVQMQIRILGVFGGEDYHWPALMTDYTWSQPGVAERAAGLFTRMMRHNRADQRYREGGNLVDIATKRLEGAIRLLDEMYDNMLQEIETSSTADKFSAPPFHIPLQAMITLSPVITVINAVFHAFGDSQTVSVSKERAALCSALKAAGFFESQTFAEMSEHYRRSKQAELSALIGTSIPPTSRDSKKSSIPPSEMAIAIYRCTGPVGPNADDLLPPDYLQTHNGDFHHPCSHTLLSASSALAHLHASDYVGRDEPPSINPWQNVEVTRKEAFLGENDAAQTLKLMLRLLRSEPWNSGLTSKRRPIVFFPQASVVAEAVVRACGKDPMVTTTNEMDGCKAVFVCQAKTCGNTRYRQYMHWRTAVMHWMTDHFHDDRTTEVPQFTRIPERDALRIVQRGQPKPPAKHRAMWICIKDDCEELVKTFCSREEAQVHAAIPPFDDPIMYAYGMGGAVAHDLNNDIMALPAIDVPFDDHEPAAVWNDLDQYTQVVVRRAAKKARHYLASIGHTSILTRVPSPIPAPDTILRPSTLPPPHFIPHPDSAWKLGRGGPRGGVGAQAEGWPAVSEDLEAFLEKQAEWVPKIVKWTVDFADGHGRQRVLDVKNLDERLRYSGPKRVFEVDSESESEGEESE